MTTESEIRILQSLSILALIVIVIAISYVIHKIDVVNIKENYCRLLMHTSSGYEFRLEPGGTCQVISPVGNFTDALDALLFEPDNGSN